MGAWLSVVSECLWREAVQQVEQPSLVEHYRRLQKDLRDIERLLEERVLKTYRCC